MTLLVIYAAPDSVPLLPTYRQT